MATQSFIYDTGAEGIADGTIDWEADSDIKVRLIASSATPAASDADLSSGYTAIGTDQTLANKTVTLDSANSRTLFDADDVTYLSVASGSTIGWAIVYKDSGSGIPIAATRVINTATDGGNIPLTWAPDRIFELRQGVPFPTMYLIETQTPSGVSSITFSSLGSYTNLLLMWSARSSLTGVAYDALLVRYNGDTSANYDFQDFYAQGTGVGAGSSVAATAGLLGYATAANAPTNVPGNGQAQIPDYLGTTFKKTGTAQYQLQQSTATGGQGARLATHVWRSTAAITSLTVLLQSGNNFVAGSKFSLYGLD